MSLMLRHVAALTVLLLLGCASTGKQGAASDARHAVETAGTPGFPNAEHARVLPEFTAHSSGESTVARAVFRRDLERYGHSVRDANFNNSLKVDFENRLVRIVVQKNVSALYAPVLKRVSDAIMRYLGARAAHGMGAVDEQLSQLGKNMGGMGDQGREQNTIFIGRLESTGLDIVPQIKALAESGGTIYQVIFSHHQFMDQIWGKDYFEIPNQELRVLADSAGVRVVAPKSARWGATSEVGGTKVIQPGGVFGESSDTGPGLERANSDEKLFSKVEKGIGNRPGRARFDPGPSPPPSQQGSRTVERFGSAPDSKGREQTPRTEQLSGISAREG